KIDNLENQDNKVNIILPIPRDFGFQKIIGKSVFKGVKYEIKKETNFGNQYVEFTDVLLPHESTIASMKFTAEIRPRYKEKNSNIASDEERKLGLKENSVLKLDEAELDRINVYLGKAGGVSIIVKKLYNYVRDTLKYGGPIEGLYSSQDALSKSEVDCGGFSTLLCALLVSRGISARIVSGFWAGYADNGMHVWVEYLSDSGRWIGVDASSDKLFRQGRSYKSGHFGFLGSDRIAMSVGCGLIMESKEQVDILQNPIVTASLGEQSCKWISEFKVIKK
ncbi:MAG: hypothetical protein COU81_02915, partial [Candidatus Portnoybacteria bacterium CG10_big_fil_rev_8_21_14_0_10_36_7]